MSPATARNGCIALLLSLAAAACAPGPENAHARGVDPNHGRDLAAADGCGACHDIPGIDAVRGGGEIGPPLSGFARRASIAGMLPNTPDQLLNWLRAPQSLKPGDAMPDLGLSEADARDIAAYLYLIH